MLGLLYTFLMWFSTFCGFLSLVTYFVPLIRSKFWNVQNLKEKYGDACKWALVTGGSSGIGRAMVEQLAEQGINVVIVAYPDKLLESSVEEYQKAYPDREFRKIGADLSKKEFLEDVVEKTKDLDISLLFNNAGFMKTGFFTTVPLGVQLANHDCNATSVVQLTHHFVREMQEKKLKGAVTFTSSPAGFMPCPFSVIYGASKAFLTEFAVSLAPEIKEDGIDCCVVHPSPVTGNSNFYKGAHGIDTLLFFKKTGTGGESIVKALFRSVGREVVCDQGYYPPMVKLLAKIVDTTFLANIIPVLAPSLPDYQAVKNGTAKKLD